MSEDTVKLELSRDDWEKLCHIMGWAEGHAIRINDIKMREYIFSLWHTLQASVDNR